MTFVGAAEFTFTGLRSDDRRGEASLDNDLCGGVEGGCGGLTGPIKVGTAKRDCDV